MVYCISKYLVWPIISLFIKKIEGIENLPDKPFILVANHESYIDGAIFMMAVAWHKNKQLCYFATNEKFTGPFWNIIFNHFGAIRVNGSLKKGIRALAEGKSMGIFPEGARTYTHEPQKIQHTGLGALTLITKAPVVPAAVHTYDFWNRYQKTPTFKKNIVVTIGKPMSFKGKPTKQNIRKTINAVWSEVRKLARISHA
jgi:1-acyl-sn-glycerol-3-phosphate acyltransferase